MSVNILIKRSDVASKRPDPNALFDGELALNFDAATGGLYYKDSNDDIVKIGPCQISATAPNSTPAGSSGNSIGELWFNTVANGLFIWDGTTWVDVTSGIAVQTISGSSPITVDNTDPTNPVIGIDAASTTQSGAVQLNDAVTSTSTTEAATANAVKTAYDLAAAAIPDSTFTAAGELIVGTGGGTYTVLAPGAAEYVLQSNGDGTLSWIVNSAGDVTSVSGTAPIQVDNTDPQTPVVSVDAATTSSLGVVQVGTNIDVTAGTISVANSSTTAKGVVQLNDTTNNSSTDLALTAAQGKSLQDQIDALAITSNLTFAGTFDTTVGPNGVMTTVSAAAAGLAVPFVVGNPLPAPSAGNAEFFVIVTGTVGIYGPTTVPASAPPYHLGDWFLSDGTNWEFLNVGFQYPAATTTVEGVVYLATDLEVQTGTDTSNKAVNPASLQAKVSDSTSTTSSTTIASSTAVKAAYDAGVAAQATADAALPKAGGTMTGTLNTLNVCLGTGNNISFNGGASGTIRGISDATGNTNDDIAASSTAVKNAYALADAAVPKACYTALGALAAGTGVSTVGTLALGTSGQFLAANSACGTGLEWCTLSLACVPCSAFTAVGTILAGNGAGTYCSLSVGTNGQVLVPNSACAAGVEWVTRSALSICGYTCTATPFNTAIGANAGDSITTGVNNTSIGYNAGTAITGGLNNTFVGFDAGDGITSADNNVAVGSRALSNTGGNNNTAVGYCTGGGLTSGGQNTFIGGIAGYRATTLDCAVAVGYGALSGVATGTGQVAVGANALAANTSGAGNTAVGFNSGVAITTGSNNTVLGFNAGDTISTGTQNTFLGACSGGSLAGTSEGNTGIGFSALGQGITSGAYNTVVGNNAGLSVTSGALNTLIGYTAGQAITTGGSNTLVGRYIGTSALSNNVVLSDGAGTIRFQSNASGAISLGAGGAYGTAGQVLVSQGSSAAPTWVDNTVDGVQGVTGTTPITVDNTDPANPIIGASAASTSAAGVVQLNDTVTSTSTTQAATANAVKAAYDAAIAAQTNGPLTSDTVLYVNCTDGNDLTAARGTDRPYATVAAALAAASEGDSILLSPGTFTESFTISKGVNISGTYSDQATWSGTKIIGNVVVNLVGAGVIRNLAVSDIYFISTNSTSPMSVTGMSPGAGGINTFTNCTFTQQLVTDTAQFAFQTSGTWTRTLYLRNCSIDGNFKHNAGTAAGASGYIVIDYLQGIGNNTMYHHIATGTAEYRNPSNTLASILQTGGIVLINNASSGITANGATTSSVFGGTGFSYKGSAVAAGSGTVYFQGGSNQGTGKVDIGANVIYGWTNLTIDPANLTVSGSAIAYTTAVPSAANAQAISQQRPRLDLLKTTSSVTAANQLATVIDSATGAIYSVSALDAGTF